MAKMSIRDLDLAGKRLFMRVDFNVPVKDGKVSDDTRIQASLPSIKLAQEKKAKIILASHLGRPKGKPQPEFSLKPVADRLSAILGQPAQFVGDCVGAEVEAKAKALAPGQVLLLENVRFHEGETKNDPEFSRQLAALAEVYVNDAFGSAHRAHSSTYGVPEVLGKGAAGLLMERELESLSKVLFHPERPVVAILGGAKVSDKIEVIENLLTFANAVLLGGGMAYTFFKAQGKNIGKSLLEEDKLDVAKAVLEKAKSRGVKLLLPVDHVVAPKLEAGVETKVLSVDEIPDGWMGLDIGPKTVEQFEAEIAKAKTIIWNGPVGVFEIDAFAKGTMAIAQAVAGARAFSLIGGGDSISAVKKAGVTDKIGHISTGGGASLEFLAGEKLPGVEILTEKK
ncbi:MAG: phosphoglycerate kinase [Acidobacteria bacterium]|nr:MAG: phosphoglycerate kinase [Acidobacteriota bacterium]